MTEAYNTLPEAGGENAAPGADPHSSQQVAAALQPPLAVERTFYHLQALAQADAKRLEEAQAELAEVDAFLALAPEVSERMDQLSSELFGQLLGDVEQSLTQAIGEVLGQQRDVRAVRELKRGKLTIRFEIDRDGDIEDLLTGQGGSVANVVSVGLRLMALARLPEDAHRRFLVLDEQDCWLRPELVPRFMRLVAEAARTLGFQLLVISHHDIDLFSEHADRVYKVVPDRGSGAFFEAFAN